jgi:aspartate kinase
MIVLKFGGTSLESAEAIERVAGIVRSRLSRHPAVVVSAHGKATDNLLALGRHSAEGRGQGTIDAFNALKEYHLQLAAALLDPKDRRELESFLTSHFGELLSLLQSVHGTGKLSPQAQDAVVSFGERLSSGIVAMALRKSGLDVAHLDARMLVRTNDQHTDATPLLDETRAKIQRALFSLSRGTVPVLGGFIGSTPAGVTTTLGRNSSNLTAVLVAAAVNADEVEIWTDVDGVYAHDPRLVRDQYPVEELSFDDALEMAYNGVRVLHAGAVQLARQEDVPLWIKNSRNPESPGTRIASGGNLVRTSATTVTCSAQD